MPETKKQLDISDIPEGGFYEMQGDLYFVNDKGDMFKLDFDISEQIKRKENAIKNNIEKGSNMDNPKDLSPKADDMTSEQLEENYWVDTSKTRIDGSIAMMEKRISGCMETTGKSREECTKEVKTRMSKEGADVKTDTIKNDANFYEENKKEDEEDEEEDFVKICPKKLDMLEKKAKEYDNLIKERESEKAEFKKVMDFVDKLKEERSKELEDKRTNMIKALVNDFQLPEEEIAKDSIEELEKTRRRFDMALKANESPEEEITEDFQQVQDDFNKKVAELDAKYKVKF